MLKLKTLTPIINEPKQALRFKSLDDIINALPVAERRAIRKESRRISSRYMRTGGLQSHRDVLMWYADWVREPYHDKELSNDIGGAWILIESMKIGPEFLAQEMWTLPS